MRTTSTACRLIDGIGKLLDRGAQAAILMLLLTTALDTCGRYLADRSLPGALELTENYWMIAVVFLSLARTQQLDGNIRIDILRDRFAPQIRRWLDFSYLVCALAVYALITFVALRFGWQALQANRWTTGLLPLPVGPSWIILGVGTTALCLRLLLQSIELARGAGAAADIVQGRMEATS